MAFFSEQPFFVFMRDAQRKENLRSIGALGENIAQRYFEKRGFRLWKKNLYFREGEIDLVMIQGNTVVCVEVKMRRSSTFGFPEESLTLQKRKRLHHLAYNVARMLPRWYVVRVDALSILYHPFSNTVQLRHRPFLRF